MPLKPKNSYPSPDDERRKIADKTAGIIERHIVQVAHDLYGNDFELERFTNIRWNGYIRKSFLKSLAESGKTLLFHIEILNPLPEGYIREVTEIYISVDFGVRATIERWSDLDEIDNMHEKVHQCCKNISADTGLTVAVQMGSGGPYGVLHYIHP